MLVVGVFIEVCFCECFVVLVLYLDVELVKFYGGLLKFELWYF